MTAKHDETMLITFANGQEYADDSVAMANLWVARNLSFLNELSPGGNVFVASFGPAPATLIFNMD